MNCSLYPTPRVKSGMDCMASFTVSGGGGGSSFSVYLHKDDRLSMVYESGSLLAEEHVKRYVTWFNGNSSRDISLAQSFDSQSEEQGIQPEAIHMANVGGKRILFLGNERTSTIFVFSFEYPSTPRLLKTVTNINEKWQAKRLITGDNSVTSITRICVYSVGVKSG